MGGLKRAERRRLMRKVGAHRSPEKRGSRVPIRSVEIKAEEPETHRSILRLPGGFLVVRNREPKPKAVA